MQTTDPYSSRVTATVGQPDMPAQPLTLLADLLTAPTVSEPSRSDWSWPPRHTARFIGECDQRLLVSAVEELGTKIQGGDWLPFEQALTKRLDLLQNQLSKTMLTSLARAPPGLRPYLDYARWVSNPPGYIYLLLAGPSRDREQSRGDD